ncbi:MAG: LPS export ABC transporter periplasmic protein LptC [Gammaproteobacteria bacterium]|nr:LPS export ABC transporter periplasmic protein LptC [Gammaproteobacteria bacterium]
MSNLRKSLLIISVIILSLSLGLRIFKMRSSTPSLTIKPQDFNALIKNVHWIQFDEEGMLNQEFSTPKIKNFSLNNQHIIYAPSLIVRKLEETWKIKADFANSKQDTEAIELKKNVLIELEQANKEVTRFSTEHLSYEPKNQKAFTDHQVQITQGMSILYATGMQAYLSEAKSLKLSHVTGQYYPSKAARPHG